MTYQVLLDEDVKDFLDSCDDKTKRIIKENLQKLAENPYPGSGKGDKKKITYNGREISDAYWTVMDRYICDQR